ncbi:MAG TPA: FecR family protein [Planctomicrobium sp.]|nr:FecR family protein [Planctomicrobium sp.]
MLRKLIDAMLDEEIDEAGHAQLEQLILNDPEARRIYVQQMAMVSSMRRCLQEFPSSSLEKSGLSKLLSKESGTSASRLTDASRKIARLFRSPLRHRRILAGTAAIAIIAMLLLAFQKPDRPAPDSHLAVAWLQSDGNCRWGEETNQLKFGDGLFPGKRVELTEGMAKFEFEQGATVVLAAPSSFEALSPTSLRLHYGTVAVKANGPVKDFKVITPDAAIVDLGTSFGVHCDQDSVTDVEVFEGAVEVHGPAATGAGAFLGMGASARVQLDNHETQIIQHASDDDRFGDLLEKMWDNMRMVSHTESDRVYGPVEQGIEANFSDPPFPGQVDTFEGSARGRGWVTPWIASGNPISEIRTEIPLNPDGSPYLHLRFENSFDRTIGREYGVHNQFDPSQPHVISWRWRLDGVPERFGNNFRDRIHFYANPTYRRNSWPENSWLIGVSGAHETVREQRQVLPNHWYVFDGSQGDVFERSNMIDTGMELQVGVIYSFTITVYPNEALYDVSITDDKQTYARSGLKFRNQSPALANVLHFGLCTNDKDDDIPFSFGSVQIRPLKTGVARTLN